MKNVKKETQKIIIVANQELRKLDNELANPSHLTSNIPEKKEKAEVRFGLKEEKEQPVNEQPTPIETIVIESSNDKQEVINIQPIAVNQPKTIQELAEKYNVPFFYGKAQAGCPGIMNPIGETPEIELNWGLGWNKEDKTHRYNQFKATLELLENFGKDSFKDDYVKLSVFGRAMLVHIASVQGVISCDEILQTIAPYASEELNLQEVPFGKNHGITVQKIFDQHVGAKTSIYLEDPQDIELEQVIQESLKESKSEEVKVVENNNQKQNLDVAAEKFLELIYNQFDELKLKDKLNPLREAFGLEKLEKDLDLVDFELFQTVLKSGAKTSEELEEDKEHFTKKFEQELVNHIANKTVYKSYKMNKLNPVIVRINEINKLKDSNASQIKILEANRDVNTIDVDIFNFALKSEFCPEVLKLMGVIQIGIFANTGYHFTGSEDLVNDYDSQFHPQKDLVGEDN